MPKFNDTYRFAGVSTDAHGNQKVRFTADNIRRSKWAFKNGAEDIVLTELPAPMTKIAALQFLQTLPEYADPGFAATIADALAYRLLAKSKMDGTYKPNPRGRPRKKAAPTGEVTVRAKRGRKPSVSLEQIALRTILGAAS